MLRKLALCAAAVVGMSSVVSAQSIISGNYSAGAAFTSRGNIMAPAGTWIVENGTLSYQTQKFTDGSGNSSTIGTVDILVNRTLIGKVLDNQVLGADFFPGIVFPFANAPMRPTPDSKKDFQLGDIFIQPAALGWHSGNWHSTVGWNLVVPSGRFNAGASNNLGKGLYSNILYGGTTWLQDGSRPWAATVTARYELMGKQKDTNIEPGDVLTLEFGASKQISDTVELGLLGYTINQVTSEKGSAPGTDITKYRTMALGPEVTWHPAGLPGSVVTARWYREFESRNTSEGNFFVLSLAYGF